MEHEICVSREVKNLGHPNAARLIKETVQRTLEAEKIESPCLVSVLLTDEEGIRRVNREFRGVDQETDVLSFPLNELEPGRFDPARCEKDLDTGELLLGDMLLNLPRCERQGRELGHGFERELMYLTVHSVLHLLGYDHVDEGPMKQRMREREKAIMKED